MKLVFTALKPHHAHVLTTLINLSTDENLSVPELAERAGYSKFSFIRIVRELETAGFVKVKRFARRGQPNQYEIPVGVLKFIK